MRTSSTALVNNYYPVRRNLIRTEKLRAPEITPEYVAFMKEYETLGHMTLIEKPTSMSYFIPHQPVLQPRSTMTKLRIIFNASHKTSGVSLNDILLPGPVVQSELFDILIAFCQHITAFTADIEKMYRCVLLHPDDRYLQRIL